MVRDVRRTLESGDLDPGSFLFRGPAGFLVFGAVDAAAVAALARTDPRGWKGVLAALEQNPALLALLHRCVAALAGSLTVLAVMRLARRELGDAAALCAGLVLAVAYLHVRDSHLGTVDVLWGLVLVLALDSCSSLVRDPSARRHAWSGLLVGAAVAVKYFSVVLGLHLCLAHLRARSEARRSGRPPPGIARLALAFVLVPLGFAALFPGLFTGSLTSLAEHLGIGVDEMAPRWDGLMQLSILAFHLRRTFAVGLGEPLLLAAVAGLVIAWRRGGAGRFLVLSVLGVQLTLFMTDAKLVRYGMAGLVVLTIPAGLALAELLARLPRAAGALALALVLFPSLARSVALDRVWQRTDTRLLIVPELRRRCAPEDRVLALGFHTDQPYPLRPWPFDYVNYLLASALGRLTLERVLDAPPRWILWGQGLPLESIEGGPELRSLVDTRYREVLHIENRPADAREPLEDPPDGTVPRALAIPYSRPWAVERPGPAMVLYERVE